MKKTFFYLIFSLSIIFGSTLISSCNQQNPASITNEMEYATLLQIEDLDEEVTLCRILDPWRTERVLKQYLIVPKTSAWNEKRAEECLTRYGEAEVVRTPLTSITLTSACHAWLLSQLEALDHVSVVCDTSYVMADNVRRWMRSQKPDGRAMILDGGSSMSPNVEVMLQAESDALWISPYEGGDLSQIERLPLSTILCAEYMENNPLGRAEWMKFYGLLIGRRSEAEQLFRYVADNYRQSTVTNEGSGQKLLAELPYGATWYVPGGASTAAILYDDAGLDYYWRDDNHAGSLSLSKEAVLAQAQACDLWLIKYNDPTGDWTLDDLLRQDEIYGQFKAAHEGNVWACNTARSDFFDVTPFRPDSLLHSLVAADGGFFGRMVTSNR